jgi:hypothetical protein
MESTPLETLPNEIWLLVLEKLSFQDLLNVSITSRDLRASAEPYLYRSIHWDWRNPPLERILMLLRTIAERPYVADYIWHVTMMNWEAAHSGEEDYQIGRAEKQWMKQHQRFRPTLRWVRMLVRAAKFPTNVEKQWVTLLAEGDEYVHATLLLSLLHNLRSLRLDFAFITELGLPGVMLHHSLFGNVPSNLLSKFTKLEMVDYGGNVPLVSFESLRVFGMNHQFMPWFHLPSLKILEIWIPCFEGITWLTDPIAMLHSPPLLSLRSFVIARSSATAEELATLLSKVPSLTSVHVGLAYRCVATTDFLKESQSLMYALEAKSKTLQHLSISVEVLPGCAENYNVPLDGIASEPFRGFLKKFPNLKSVELPYNFLFGWSGAKHRLQDALPKKMEAVHIRSDFWLDEQLAFFSNEVHKSVIELLRQKPPFQQSLQIISYEGPPTDTRGWEYYEESTPEMPLLHREAYLRCTARGIFLDPRHPDWMPGNVVMRGQWPEGSPSVMQWGLVVNCWPWHYHQRQPPFIRGVM